MVRKITIEIDDETGELVDYWTLKKFAELNNVKYRTAVRWVETGKIEALKIATLERTYYFIPIGTPPPEYKKRKRK